MTHRNKKTAFFIPSLRGGGAERVFVNLVNELVKRGFEVDLVLAQKEGPYLTEVNNKVNIVDLKSKRVLFSLFPLTRYLKKEKPDMLIASMEHANIIAVLAKILSGSKTKIVARVANTLSLSLKGTKIYKRWLRKYGAMVFYRFADKIIANSKGSADDLAKTLKIPRDKINVIYNPTITSSVFEKANKEANHKWLKEKSISVILGVGRLNKQKDFSTLIKAFGVLKKKTNAKLIILGEGEERKKLEQLIKELNLENDVDLPGFVDNPYAYMTKVDVYVLSSQWEGLPNTLIEAMACETPVVSTDCLSGPSEILDNGKYGGLIPVNNSKIMADKVEYVLNLSEEERRKITESARKTVEERFSVEKMVEEYEKLYEKILKTDEK